MQESKLQELKEKFNSAREFAKNNPSKENRDNVIKIARELESLAKEITPLKKAGFASRAGQRQYKERNGR